MCNSDSASAIAQADAAVLQRLLGARCYLYRLFHKLLGGEPCEELLSAFVSDETMLALAEYGDAEGVDALTGMVRAFSSETIDMHFLERMGKEYNRIFLSIGQMLIYPWESCHVSRKPVMFHPTVLLVRQMYESYGLQGKRHGHVPDDHISLMCAFMAELSERALSYFEGMEWSAFKTVVADQYHFLDRHIVNWMPSLVEQSVQVEGLELYPRIIAGLCEFVRIDRLFSSEAVAWTDESSFLVGSVSDMQVCAFLDEMDKGCRNLERIRPKGIEEYELVRMRPN